MFDKSTSRFGHYAILLAIAAVLCLANLGAPSLWDIDEGKNAEAAREMLESGDWVVPTFNYDPRYEKPVLLYWLQVEAYRLFGINEFAARFPSALAAMATVMLVYELGRRLFGPMTGLFAGLILASSIAFCLSSHFANPDSLLNAFIVLTLFLFWHSFDRCGRCWFVPTGISMGLGMLAKGPVALLMPAAVIGLFLVWTRKLRLLRDRRLVWGSLAFAATALPWYVWVAIETRGRFLTAFFFKENVNRFLTPMEHHSGPIFYYLVVLLAGFAPWCIFIGVAGWFALGERGRRDAHLPATERGLPRTYRFLWCWIAVYLIFFSLAGTKLPNYILPIYAPLALLTARFLERWRSGVIQPPAWTVHLGIAALACIGIGTSVAFLVAGGIIDLPAWHGFRVNGMAYLAVLGIVPAAAAGAMWWCYWRQNRVGFITTLSITATLYNGALVAWGSMCLDAHKAPRTLVETAGASDAQHDIRVGCYRYFQPSLVFYCRRDVQLLDSEANVLEFLKSPLPVYLFMPATEWAGLEPKAAHSCRVLARHEDLYKQLAVVVVGNR